MRMMKIIGSAAIAALALAPVVANATGNAALLSIVDGGDAAPAHASSGGSSTLVLAALGIGAVIAGAVALGSGHNSGTAASA